MAQHRSEWRLLRYPIKSYVRYWHNRWAAFLKPALKRRISKITVR